MASIVIHHTVKDYSAWRPIYDEHEKSRRSAGITNAKVFRRVEDPNELVVLADVADVAKARSWMSSDHLKSAMQKAGVTGPPKIHIIT